MGVIVYTGPTVKVWEFEKESQSKDFLRSIKKSLLCCESIYRMPGNGERFFIRTSEDPSECDFYITTSCFKAYEGSFKVYIRFCIKDTSLRNREVSRFLSFPEFFESMPEHVKKELAFHLDLLN